MSRLQPSSSSGPSNSSGLQMPSAVASLRTRRPSAKPPAEPSKLRKGSTSDGKPKDRMSRVVSDKIKKRLSMRYADDTNPLQAPPAVPSIPSAYTSQQPHYQSAAQRNHHPASDVGALARRPTIDASNGQGGGGASMWGEDAGTGGGRAGAYDSGLDLESVGMAGIGVRKGSMAAGEDERMGRRGGITLDLSLLGKEGFDAEAYIKSKLAGASSEEIRNFAKALESSKAATSTDLQRNVFKNYAEFVVISKEIATLENDMLELKDLLGEWKGVPEALVGLELDDPILGTRKTSSTSLTQSPSNRRSSVLDLQNLYRNQLLALHHSVSGAQKFVPLVPGRHIVAEAAAFVELNPATYKLKGPVRLFVLNDLVLVAVIKKRRMGEGEGGRSRDGSMNGRSSGGRGEEGSARDGRLVADRCWTLTEVTVVDVKDSGDLTNAIKIRRGKETAIFRTERNEDKKALLGAFRQVAESLAEQKRKNIEKEQEKRRSLWQTDMNVSISSTSGIPPIPNLPSSSSSIGRSPSRHNLPGSRSSISDLGAILNGAQTVPGLDSQGKDLRWIDDFGDELAVAIALRNWDEAVRLVLKAREHLAPVQSSSSASQQPPTQPHIHLLRAKLLPLSDALLSSLTHELSSPTLRKHALVQLVSLFYSLDQQHLASSTFLAARTEVLKKRVRTIKFEGDIGGYVNELAIVTFMGVKNTSDWFQAGFKEHVMISGLVEWAKEQIETFSKMFRRQVFGPDVDPTVVQESLEAVRVQSKKFLTYEGLDLSFLLRSLLADNPNSQAINQLYESSSPTTHTLTAPSPLPSALPTTLPSSSTSSAPYLASPAPHTANSTSTSNEGVKSPYLSSANSTPLPPPTAPLATRPSRPRAPSSANRDNSSTSIPRYTATSSSSSQPQPPLPQSSFALAASPSLDNNSSSSFAPVIMSSNTSSATRNNTNDSDILASLGRPVASMERTQSSTGRGGGGEGISRAGSGNGSGMANGEGVPPPRPPRRERKPGPPGAI